MISENIQGDEKSAKTSKYPENSIRMGRINDIIEKIRSGNKKNNQ
jgi:hypothetical protein